MSAGATAAIETRALSKTYRLGFWMNRKVMALNGLNLRIEPGSGLRTARPERRRKVHDDQDPDEPGAGHARVRPRIFGRDAFGPRMRAGTSGFLPENPAPYEYLTGREFVTLAGRLAGMSGHELDLRVREVLGAVGMERTANLQIRRYSKGMVQRIGLAQAIVARPRLLILDEPTSGLDPVGRREMRDLILQERQRGTTILFCTHIIPDVEALCDRVAVLVNGNLAREGSVQDLLTTQVPLMEVTVEGLPRERIEQFGIHLEEIHDLGGRLVVRASAPECPEAARGTSSTPVAASRSVQPARFSLEDLFLQAMSEAKHGTVGGEIA